MTDYFPAFKVEIAFVDPPGTLSPTWTDVTSYVSEFHTRRGKSDELGAYQAGTATVTFDNSDGSFYPNDPSSSFGAGTIFPVRQIRITANLIAGVGAGSPKGIFQGYIEQWPPAWPGAFEETTTITAVDAFKVLGLCGVRSSRPAELTSDRAGIMAGLANIPYTNRVGVSTAQIQDVDSTALAHCQEMELTENGQFYIGVGGDAIFEGRRYRPASKGALAATLNDDADASGGTGILYDDITPSFDDQNIWNETVVNADIADTPNIATQSDATSITNYFKRTLSRSINVKDGLEANDAGNWLLNRYKNPGLRFDTIVVRPALPVGSSTGYELCVNAEFGDLWRVLRHPPHGSTIDVKARVEAIAHDVVATGPQRDWLTTFSLSPDLGYRSWILEDASNGQLDVSTVLAY